MNGFVEDYFRRFGCLYPEIHIDCLRWIFVGQKQ